MPSSVSRKRQAAEERLDAVFSALADRTRRALLDRLARGPAKISELAQPFDMSRIAVSKHVKVLERAQLVKRAIDGRVHRCSLAAEPLWDIEQWLDHYRLFWADTLGALAHYVDRPDEGR